MIIVRFWVALLAIIVSALSATKASGQAASFVDKPAACEHGSQPNIVSVRQPFLGSVQASAPAFDSTVYSVIARKSNGDCQVHRQTIAGGETVLDAVSQYYGLSQLEGKKIWIVRLAPHNGGEQILNVDWDAILSDGQMATNYQIHPGDRIWIVPGEPSSQITTVLKGFYRIWQPQPTYCRGGMVSRSYRNSDDL